MMLSSSVDLNADVGEAEQVDGIATERSLLSLVTSVNVACGGHAGDERSMHDTVRAALAHGVVVGGHPSYPDRVGFGRRPLAISADELEASLRAQLTDLRNICVSLGTAVHSVKPHGALYGEVARGGMALDALRSAAASSCDPGTPLVVLAGSPAERGCRAAGVPVRAEGFCDRAYTAEGGLVDRAVAGAVLNDAMDAARQAVALARRGSFDTLCVHGDSPGAVEMARAVRVALDEAGIAVAVPS
jgi:UPF0271 protein